MTKCLSGLRDKHDFPEKHLFCFVLFYVADTVSYINIIDGPVLFELAARKLRTMFVFHFMLRYVIFRTNNTHKAESLRIRNSNQEVLNSR